jgi:hypothetical protein
MGIFGFLQQIFVFFNKMFDWFRQKQAIEHGKELKEIEIIKSNQKIEKEQTEILLKDRTKEEVIDKMEKGTF